MSRQFYCSTAHVMWVLAACVVLGLSASVFAIPPLTPYDQRAAAALFTLLEPKAPGGGWTKEWDAAKIDQKRFDTLNVHTPNKEDSRYVFYAVHFNAAKPSEAGAYRILLNSDGEATTVKDPATGPKWTPHPANDARDPKKIAFFYRRLDAQGFQELVSRQKIGGLMLTIFERRPLGESIDDSLKDLNTRHSDLMLVAQKYKLLRTGRVVQVLMSPDGSTEMGELGTAPRPFGLGEQEKRVVIRVKILDVDDKPLDNVKRITLELTGWMKTARSAHANLAEIPGAKHEGDRLVLEDPRAGFLDVTLVVPARSVELEQEIFEQLRAGGGGGAGLRVGVALK